MIIALTDRLADISRTVCCTGCFKESRIKCKKIGEEEEQGTIDRGECEE